MADLVITAANVLQGAGAVIENGIIGTAFTAGQAVYKDANGQWSPADSNSATVLQREAKAIALNGGGAGQPCVVQKGGEITIGAALTAGVAYYLSDTPGGICPLADVGAGEYIGIIGIAKSATVLKLGFLYSGFAN